jgi:hypothetical protein
MITGGSFRNEKFILASESDADAIMIKRGLCGKTDVIALAPYGNKAAVSTAGNTLIFRKQSGLPLTYEEAHNIIKKIRLFEKVSDKVVNHLQREARMQLKAPLTLFYPSAAAPVIQIAFSYNWVSFEVERPDFAAALPLIHDAILTAKHSSILKAFSNNADTISVHNYDMGGIYVPRTALAALAETLLKYNLIKPDEKNVFVTRVAAFGVHSVSYMDARQLSQNVDETFELSDDKNYNPLIGQPSFLIPALQGFSVLATNGDFKKLGAEQIQQLRSVLVNPESLKPYGLSETIAICIASFVQDFKNEIADAYRNLPS